MAITIPQNYTVVSYSSGKGTYSIPRPSMVQEGDIIVVTIMNGNENGDTITASGFTRVPTQSNVMQLFYKKAGPISSEPSNYIFNLAGGNGIAITVFRGQGLEVILTGEKNYNVTINLPTQTQESVAITTTTQETSSGWTLMPTNGSTYGGQYKIFPANSSITLPSGQGTWHNTTGYWHPYILIKENIVPGNVNYIGGSSGYSHSSAVSVSRPAVQAGDLIVVHLSCNYNNISDYAGFTKVPSFYNNGRGYVWKIATSNEPSSYTFRTNGSQSTNNYFTANLVVYRNARIYNDARGQTTSAWSNIPQNNGFAILSTGRYAGNANGQTEVAYSENFTLYHSVYSPGNRSSVNIAYAFSGWYYSSHDVLVIESTGGTPPTKPGKPSIVEHLLTGETLTTSWTPSTIETNEEIAYKIELYNGNAWIEINTINTNSYSFIIPNGINTNNAKIRITALSQNSSSETSESDIFIISKQLLLIQDGDIIKTYKNGAWQTI